MAVDVAVVEVAAAAVTVGTTTGTVDGTTIAGKMDLTLPSGLHFLCPVARIACWH